MKLTDQQLNNFAEEGYLFLPDYFSQAEVDAMKSQLDEIFDEDSPRRVVEKDGQCVRSVYGSHHTNELFGRLARHPRLVEPARQLLDSDIYVYQFKINAKARFSGDLWDWHYDYVFWQKEDGLPQMRVTNVAIFLDEVTEFNGPMFLIPRSHHFDLGDVPARKVAGAKPYHRSPAWISNLTADLKYSLDHETVADLVEQYGMVAPKGPAGSVLFFHCSVVHASANNISPFDRVNVIVTYNSVENVPTGGRSERPDFLVSRNYEPLTPVADDALLTCVTR
jgi:hypothetical protein